MAYFCAKSLKRRQNKTNLLWVKAPRWRCRATVLRDSNCFRWWVSLRGATWQVVGDIALWYLPYVPMLLESRWVHRRRIKLLQHPDSSMPCCTENCIETKTPTDLYLWSVLDFKGPFGPVRCFSGAKLGKLHCHTKNEIMLDYLFTAISTTSMIVILQPAMDHHTHSSLFQAESLRAVFSSRFPQHEHIFQWSGYTSEPCQLDWTKWYAWIVSRNVRVVALKRNREDTVASFERWFGGMNHFPWVGAESMWSLFWAAMDVLVGLGDCVGVAAARVPQTRFRLALDGRALWCHALHVIDYDLLFGRGHKTNPNCEWSLQ